MMATVMTPAVPKWQSSPHLWFTDSCTSDHFLPHRDLFETFRKLEESVNIEAAEVMAMGTVTGRITITVLGNDDTEMELQLNDVIYTAKMHSNLFSLAAAYNRRFETR